MTINVNDPALEPPERPDFRRVNRGVPMVMDETTGKFTRYKRASSSGNILDDDANLVDWSKRTIIYGASQRPDLMAMASTLNPDVDKKSMRDIVEDCLVSGKGTQRATSGTAVHRMLDLVDLDADWVPAPQFQAAVNAYVRTLDLYGLVPVDVEVHCVDDLRRIAGTADRRYRTTRNLVAPDGQIIPIGSVLVGDTKTGKSLEYAAGSYATQIAAYVDSVRYDVVTNERTPFDPPTYPDWALIMHVDAADGRCDVYWVDVNAGREALALAEQVREWRKRTDLITPARAPLHALPPTDEMVDAIAYLAKTVPVPDANVPAVAPTTPVEARTDEDGTAAVRAWLRGRVDVVRARGGAPTDALLRYWPTDVPGLKHDGHTLAQLDAISEALWRVEKEFSLPFPPRDPREPEFIPRDITDRWAKPTGDDKPADDADVIAFQLAMANHPRKSLVDSWVRGVVSDRDNWALVHALYEFAMLSVEDWSDADTTEMLDGTLRALGYADGLGALGDIDPKDAPKIMSAALAIQLGDALLLFDENGKPVVRTITNK